MKKSQNKFKVLLCSVLCFISMSSCKGEVEHPVLERGKPIDLAKVDFQKLNLDICFSKLAYMKENIMSADKHTNSSNKPLIIRPYFLYNITEERLLKRYEQIEVDTIEKGEMYGDLYRIDRRAPLLDMRNPDTRSFGYWGSAEILFSSIFTSSTPANKLIRVRLQSGNLHNAGLKEYNELFKRLKAENKDAEFKEQPQSDGISAYEWRTKDKMIQLFFAKSEDSNFFELAIAYLNPDTKGHLKEFGN